MIETDRLIIIPLKARQLKLLIEAVESLEQEFNCTYMAEPIEGIFKEILKEQLLKTKEDEENFEFHSFWIILRKNDKVIVGLADFKDVPNSYGEIEIGYGLGKQFEHNGYMTEAAKAMCNWGLKQKNVKHIIAETDLDSEKSQKILKTIGFVKYKSNDTLWWKL